MIHLAAVDRLPTYESIGDAVRAFLKARVVEEDGHLRIHYTVPSGYVGGGSTKKFAMTYSTEWTPEEIFKDSDFRDEALRRLKSYHCVVYKVEEL